MRYVALLRGINVGGNNKVPMSILKQVFEKADCIDVVTYINSGNVIFTKANHSHDQLVEILEKAIEKEFGFYVKVLVRSAKQIKEIESQLDPTWINGVTIKCDVMFLSGEYDTPKVIEQLKLREGVDNLKYVPGTLIWWVKKENVLQSGLVKIIGTKLYKAMTIRNCNTLRKINQLINT